jgi:mRNA interferase RelE/StbE
VAAALQIASATYTRAFDALPESIREAVQTKVDSMGVRLDSFPHKRLTGRREFRLRVGDYRVLYEFDAPLGRIYLHYVGHRREVYK